MIVWLVQGQPRYISQEGRIAFISDIGADMLKPLFVTGASVTGVGFFLCLVIERYLRHSGRLMPHMRTRERVLSTLAVIWAAIGGAGLILLAVFDTARYTTHHRLFLLIFIVGVTFSAIFTIIEYRWISKDFEFARELRIAYLVKAVIASVLIVLAIAFAVALYYATNVGAVLEWVIAFLFTFYVLTYFFDLRQSKGVDRGELHHHRTGSNANVPMSQVS
ncbi:hypothetical protein EST38_g294 [Candolleomyces aberdarensis]|uniref:CWH43-like N-terminal domain-containing protein n=1 Tax=Candolleomyces aberdarensis TaxID=2316362 RepID=A0A4Q2E084_9AGAR|nr:hypothetical protein EST38_g294 [Candolleomyces aberdarensis]